MSPTLRSIVRAPLRSVTLIDSWYLLCGLLTGTVGFSFVTAAVSTAVGLSILIVGLPLAALTAHANRWWCRLERLRAAPVLGAQIAERYAPPRGTGRISMFLSVLRDRQTWLDTAWMVVALPLGVVGFAVATSVWAAVLGLISAPVWAWSIPGWVHAHVVACSIVAPLLAPPAAIAGAWLLRGAALAEATVAARLLAPTRTEMLERRVQTLAETRAGAVDAATAELQRVERDLHDGAQARLVALAMDLGLAEQRLAAADATTALEHVASARGQARAAMADLRDLVRGIGPSVLHDRGLDAALTALVSGRVPEVQLSVHVPDAPAGAREAAMYFVVAEALANARKHANATLISVHVWQDAAGRLVGEVVDDGRGGADPEAGSGLSGLRMRLAALDGTLAVSSPSGGPTTIRAELPCAS